nr:hypothetical protein GCM10025732_46880 [Glycomyces mayteni]
MEAPGAVVEGEGLGVGDPGVGQEPVGEAVVGEAAGGGEALGVLAGALGGGVGELEGPLDVAQGGEGGLGADVGEDVEAGEGAVVLAAAGPFGDERAEDGGGGVVPERAELVDGPGVLAGGVGAQPQVEQGEREALQGRGVAVLGVVVDAGERQSRRPQCEGGDEVADGLGGERGGGGAVALPRSMTGGSMAGSAHAPGVTAPARGMRASVARIAAVRGRASAGAAARTAGVPRRRARWRRAASPPSRRRLSGPRAQGTRNGTACSAWRSSQSAAWVRADLSRANQSAASAAASALRMGTSAYAYLGASLSFLRIAGDSAAPPRARRPRRRSAKPRPSSVSAAQYSASSHSPKAGSRARAASCSPGAQTISTVSGAASPGRGSGARRRLRSAQGAR